MENGWYGGGEGRVIERESELQMPFNNVRA